MYITFRAKGNTTVIYLLSDFMMAFMWIRIYNLVRTMLNQSIFMDAISKKMCNQYGFNVGIKFCLKAYLKLQPEKTVLLIFSGTVLITAYLLRVCELPYYHQIQADNVDRILFDDYFNSLWLTVITLTTVGYGDMSAVTMPGRIVTMVLALWGTTLISLFVLVVSGIFDLDEKQEMAMKHIKVMRSAAGTICSSIEYFKAKRDHRMMR